MDWIFFFKKIQSFLTFQKVLLGFSSASLSLVLWISRLAILVLTTFFRFNSLWAQFENRTSNCMCTLAVPKLEILISIEFYNKVKLKFVKILSFITGQTDHLFMKFNLLANFSKNFNVPATLRIYTYFLKFIFRFQFRFYEKFVP